MSFLDMDERILALAEKMDLVYSPLVDFKDFPDNVDVTIVEGAVSTDEDVHKIRNIRSKTKILVSLGDCAVTSNVPSMRNPFGVKAVMERAYVENAQLNQGFPTENIPPLRTQTRPVHEFVKVDAFIPGCPPHAETIYAAVAALLDGKTPDIATKAHFG